MPAWKIWRCRLREARAHDAGELRRHVRTQCDHLARLRLDETQHLIGVEGAQTAFQHALVFEDGQRHELVAVELEAAEQFAGQLAEAPRVGRQEITHSRRQRMRQVARAGTGRGKRGGGGNRGGQSRRSLADPW